RLLFGNAHVDNNVIEKRLAELAEHSAIALDRDLIESSTMAPDETPPALLAEQPHYPTRRPPYWRVTSYSRLYHPRSSSLFRADVERLDEEADNDAALPANSTDNIHRFERGAAAGNLLHALLEAALQPDTRIQLHSDGQPNQQGIGQLVERFCHQPQWQ